jgi:hypothetical protein
MQEQSRYEPVREAVSRFGDESRQRMEPQAAMRTAEDLPMPAYLGGVFGSIALSALLFIAGKREMAIFVGLWPPTILNLMLAMKQLRPSSELS